METNADFPVKQLKETSMLFDPVSWAIGFVASQSAAQLIKKVFDQSTYNAMREAADLWASQLPENVRTPSAALFGEGTTRDLLGEKRTKLKQAILDLHKIPSEEEWYEALVEAWEQKRLQLGRDGNAFFQLPKSSVEKHLLALAHALFSACASILKYSQPLLVKSMREVSATQGLILKEILSFQSPLNSFRRDGNVPIILNFDPTHIEEVQLHLLNEIVCVDTPAEIIAGRLRTHEIWIGPEGCGKNQATYVPCAPNQVTQRLRKLLAAWNKIAGDLAKRSTNVVIATVANFHHRLLEIHPYPDGNGRLARAILDLQVRNYTSCKTPLRLKSYDEYFLALRAADDGSIRQLSALLTSIVERDETSFEPKQELGTG